jgi:hypothetical protein
MTRAWAFGCSHTAGEGLDYSDSYVNLLAQHYKITIKNLAVPGGNCHHIEKNLVKQLQLGLADFVIMQWPNVFRKTVWINGSESYQNIQNSGPAFQQLLKAGEENFYYPWLQTIITCNTLCDLAQIPVVNIMIEDVDQQYHTILNHSGIILHVDQKLPGLTWLMDSAARDGMHHSAICHAQWAKRLIELIDELTTR